MGHSGSNGQFEAENLYADWGHRIEDARKALELTQAGLSTALGVSQQLVSLWERGVTPPKDEMRFALARILKSSVYDLFPFPEPNGGEAA